MFNNRQPVFTLDHDVQNKTDAVGWVVLAYRQETARAPC